MSKADYDFVVMGAGQVMVTSGGVARFAAQWPCSEPCSGMRFDEDYGVIFSFDSNGLSDIEWFDGSTGLDVAEPNGVNGEALAELSQDAQAHLAQIMSKA
jgi:hypothetical protein